MDSDFARLGEQLKAARLARRPRVSQTDAAAALGVGRSTIQKMEGDSVGQVTRTTVQAYARWLHWTEDSVDRVLAGGDPAMATDGEKPTIRPVPDLGLSPDVEYELRTGKVLGSQVFNLGPDDSDGQIIVVLQGKKDATPEEVERIAARYRKARRHLQGIASEADEVAES
ncbi:helix-turn-helix domain-containing protein [Streptomyces arenae]|uniref:helix-turn-helix domain-containing protein n=1 Tax=Streptomyces arenae TaxID=29301 RepID=UPI00265A6125|nr:helix-turn-helix transcriptional regulator [Streptomyces arenae]MCG7204011.1 helix-turn-helix domain-containing protein [Streptomyces arenae]